MHARRRESASRRLQSRCCTRGVTGRDTLHRRLFAILGRGINSREASRNNKRDAHPLSPRPRRFNAIFEIPRHKVQNRPPPFRLASRASSVFVCLYLAAICQLCIIPHAPRARRANGPFVFVTVQQTDHTPSTRDLSSQTHLRAPLFPVTSDSFTRSRTMRARVLARAFQVTER